jgi:flagellar hook-associated protein 1 FlgK
VSGAAAVGDRFMIEPTAAATAGLSVVMTDPSKIAAAAPVRSSAGTSNTGSAVISQPTILNPANPQLQTTATITFASPGSYSINGGPATAYTPGQAIALNGWSVTLSGVPAAGDTFTVQSNANATGDNSNALQLAAVFDQKTLTNGADSINTALGRFVGNLGTVTQQAQNDSNAQKAVNASDTQSLSSVAGVNLDEEAANMVKFQQAYQAAAQLISVANTLFQSLISAARGQ